LKFCILIIDNSKNVSPSLTTAKGQWLEERRNDTYLYFVTYVFL